MTHLEQAKIRIEVLIKLIEKVKKDLMEAYERTPSHFTAKPYIYRSLRTIENIMKIVKELDSFISQHGS